MKHLHVWIIGIMIFVLAGCVMPLPMVTTQTHEMAAPLSKVYFVEPVDGATVSGPINVVLGGEYFTVEPAGTIHPGAGHLHIMVDADCMAAGQVIPKDETHLHYGAGQLTAALELPAGKHTLCLQAADGAHFALAEDGMTQQITVTVE